MKRKIKPTIWILLGVGGSMCFLAIIMGLLLYNGIITFNNPSVDEYPVRGVDVASYQGKIDWDDVLKALAEIDDGLHLIAPEVIDPIQHLKVDHLGNRNPRLHTDEVLIALSICAATDPTAELAMEQLGKLRGCEVHSSVILSAVDEKVFKRLGVNLTCQPRYKG